MPENTTKAELSNKYIIRVRRRVVQNVVVSFSPLYAVSELIFGITRADVRDVLNNTRKSEFLYSRPQWTYAKSSLDCRLASDSRPSSAFSYTNCSLQQRHALTRFKRCNQTGERRSCVKIRQSSTSSLQQVASVNTGHRPTLLEYRLGVGQARIQKGAWPAPPQI